MHPESLDDSRSAGIPWSPTRRAKAPPPDPLPDLSKCRPVDGKQHPPTGLGNPCGIPTFPQGPFAYFEFRTQNAPRAAYLCVLRVARFRPRKSAPAFAPLIDVGFECNSGLSLSPVPRGPVDTLGLPRSPLRKRADTPHLAGLDATPHPLAGELGEPVRSVPASRRPPLAVLLDAPRRGSHFRHPSLRSDERSPSSESAFTIRGIGVQLQRNTHWSLTSLQQRLVKTGGRLVKHGRYYWLLLAEGHLTRRLFGDMLRKIWALPVPGG